jgi:hypothetical protein
LPPQMTAVPDSAAAVAAVVEQLRARRIVPQSPSTRTTGWDRRHVAPPVAGRCRLIDGTVIVAAGEKDPAGDPLQVDFEVNGRRVQVDCVGLVAVRLSDTGRVDALAAGGLKRFEAGDVRIALDQPADLALWRTADGQYEGVLQDWPAPVPAPLVALTTRWTRLAVPVPLSP